MFEFDPALTAALVFAITEGIKAILKQVGVPNLSGFLAIVVAAVVTAILTVGQAAIGTLPPALQQAIVLVLTFLTAAGVYRTAKRIGPVPK